MLNPAFRCFGVLSGAGLAMLHRDVMAHTLRETLAAQADSDCFVRFTKVVFLGKPGWKPDRNSRASGGSAAKRSRVWQAGIDT